VRKDIRDSHFRLQISVTFLCSGILSGDVGFETPPQILLLLSGHDTFSFAEIKTILTEKLLQGQSGYVDNGVITYRQRLLLTNRKGRLL
jgi:hypothetical protein